MKTTLWNRFPVLLPATILTALVFVSTALAQSADTLAIVNGTAITKQEMSAQMMQARLMSQQRGIELGPEQISYLEKEILTNLIDQELLYQEAQRTGIKLDESVLTDHMDGFKKRFADQQQYEEALKQRGMNESLLKNVYTKALTIRELISTQVVPSITVSEQDQRTYFDENPEQFKLPERVRASHILVKVDDDADQATRQAAIEKIQQIEKEIQDGGDFAKLAKKYSDDGNAVRGGDLGYFTRGRMVKPFEDAAFQLKIGQVSPVIQTQFGYHLIYLTDRKEAGLADYEVAKGWIRNRVLQNKTEKAVLDKIGELKKQAEIKLF